MMVIEENVTQVDDIAIVYLVVTGRGMASPSLPLAFPEMPL